MSDYQLVNDIECDLVHILAWELIHMYPKLDYV